MESEVLYELIGYIASLLVAVSLMMSAIVKLRIVNLIGAFTFAIYGVLINSIPVAGMNAFIVLINIYYLIKIYRDKTYFKILWVEHSSRYLSQFLDFYEEQISVYQPDFKKESDQNFALFVLSDMTPVGVLLGRLDDNTLHVDLDFVIPEYRDFKVGHYLYSDEKEHFNEFGVKEIVSEKGNIQHNQYLDKMGFISEGDRFKLQV